jgi:hypothetical protein
MVWSHKKAKAKDVCTPIRLVYTKRKSLNYNHMRRVLKSLLYATTRAVDVTYTGACRCVSKLVREK